MPPARASPDAPDLRGPTPSLATLSRIRLVLEQRRQVETDAVELRPVLPQLLQDPHTSVVGEAEVRQIDDESASRTLTCTNQLRGLAGQEPTVHLDRPQASFEPRRDPDHR